MTEASEHEKQLVTTFLEKAKALVPGVKIRYVERVRELGEPGLRVGLSLPEGVSLLGDQAFTIDDMAEKFSEAQKYRVAANMTPVAGTGELITITSIAKADCSEDAVVAVPAKIAPPANSVETASKKNSSGKGGGATLMVDNSVPIALLVVLLFIGVPMAWNYLRANNSAKPYLATSPGPGGTVQPNTAAGPPSVEEQQKDIEQRSTELDGKLAQLQMNLMLEGKKAESQKIAKTREKLKSAMEGFGKSKSGEK